VDQELIEMNRIATTRAARDSAAKDAHITKKMLVEAAIEKVKGQITTHRSSKISTGASVSDAEASVSADENKLRAGSKIRSVQSQSGGYTKKVGVYVGTGEDVTGGGRGRIY